MSRIALINGPNLRLLGKRNTEHYGRLTLEGIGKLLENEALKLGMDVVFFQSNHEGEIVDILENLHKEGIHGLIINPAGFTHTSVAIKDALEIHKIPKIEVHLSQILSREEFRQQSLTGASCDMVITGGKEVSYLAALHAMKSLLSQRKEK